MNPIWIKFRPSSHSEDTVIVATFVNSKMALSVAQQLRCKKYLEVKNFGKRIAVLVARTYSQALFEVYHKLKEGGEIDHQNYTRYQELDYGF